jgi:hypothetical protein
VCRVPDKQEKPSEDWRWIRSPRSFGNAASVGLVVLIGHLHMRILVISTAAQAAPASPPAASDGQDQVKPGGGSPSAGFAASLGAGFAAAAANGIRNLGHVCNWEIYVIVAMARQISRLYLRLKVVVYGRFAAGSK